jgi:uncharacterized membrane protein
MEETVLFFLLLLLAGFVLVVWLVFRTRRLAREISLTKQALRALQEDLGQALAHHDVVATMRPSPPPASPGAPLERPESWETAAATPPGEAQEPSIPPAPAPPIDEALPVAVPAMTPSGALAGPPPVPGAGAPPASIRDSINWEHFLGVKLFAWIGGLVLFLGVAFFVKYSFENNLISPQVRVAIGYLVGIGVLVGGLRLPRDRQAVTVQTLCASGVLILYANVFASHAYYRFTDASVTFALMTLVTATAFLLAVHLDAQAVAVLGLLGGFLTPPLLSTGVDRPFALFGYIGLLDIGLLAVALRKRWSHLILLAAVATVLMQGGWVANFFVVDKIYTALGILLSFLLLFVAALAAGGRLNVIDKWNGAAAVLMPSVALLFVLYLLARPYPTLARRVVLLFGFVFLVDLGFLAIAWLRDSLRPAQIVAGGGVFLLMTIWQLNYLSAALLNPALGFVLVFAVLHSIAPLLLQRLRPGETPLWWIHLYPILALLLTMIPFFKVSAVSPLVWPVVLAIDLVAIVLAMLTASLASILAVFVLTVLVTALWIIRTPAVLPELPAMLMVIGGFAVFLMAAGLYAARRSLARGDATPAGTSGARPFPFLPPELFAQAVSVGGILPFLLLTLVVGRLPVADPSSVFGLAALLVILFLGALRCVEFDLLAAVSLGGALLLEHAWHFNRFTTAQTGLAVGWYLGFSGVFLVFPFLWQRRMERRVVLWAVSALALPLHFLIIYRAIIQAFPGFPYMGLLPAVLAVPCLAALYRLVRTLPPEWQHRNTVLALFGGAGLLFITLIFPIQFERQWLTIAWGLEGLALIWLFHRVPHAGLKLAGTAFLGVAFVRLALNPAVLSYHPRSDVPILNWFLYTYGIVTLCLMVGARLLAPPRHLIRGINAPPILYGLGTVLAFLLLNIEIADYFSTGRFLTFQFSGNFGQDMTYSLAWAIFAFALLAVGFKVYSAPARYAGMGLLVVTIIKIFLHDLWQLGGLYRVGSLVGLAVVLIVASFIYQRFLSSPVLREDGRRRPEEQTQ